MNRKELIKEIERLKGDVDIYQLAIKTDAELIDEINLTKNNIRNEIFEQLGDSLSDIIGHTSKEPTSKENNKLEQLQEQLTTLITSIKIKYG